MTRPQQKRWTVVGSNGGSTTLYEDGRIERQRPIVAGSVVIGIDHPNEEKAKRWRVLAISETATSGRCALVTDELKPRVGVGQRRVVPVTLLQRPHRR